MSGKLVSGKEGEGALTTIFVDQRPTKRRLRRARLVVVDGPNRGETLRIERERITVGRSLICDLRLPDDKAVSGTHFEVVAGPAGFRLRDLDSTNGTFCGDLRVKDVWVRAAMKIRAGKSTLRFESEAGTVDIDLSAEDRFHELIGRSVRMRETFATLSKVGPSDLTVLIRGETGTGKELVARALHQSSPRRSGPLVVQDCSSIPRDLVESTLFGHERGAFTGATDRHRGSFELAEGGTIFLDEIGELDLSLQPKLLRVLENREIKRVGGDRQIPVDVRVVAATNRDLRRMVNDGTFREDLFYRLSVVQVELPPLRERPEDIPLLVEHFLHERYTQRKDLMMPLRVEPEAMQRLESYPWPGNVRELRNAVERAGSLSDGPVLGVADLMLSSAETKVAASTGAVERYVDEALPFKEAKQKVVDAFEAAYLKALLRKHQNNVTRSAQAAGLTRYHLRELAKRYGILGGAKGPEG